MTKPAKSHGRLANRPSLKPRELMTPTPDLASVWKAKVVTLFPETFPGVLGASLTGKALQEGLWQLETIDLRRFGRGKHRDVDDTPAGGGAGMVLRADVVGEALEAAQRGIGIDPRNWPIIYVSPRGPRFDQSMAARLSTTEGATFLCGRFEGVDERALQAFNIQEVSIGDYILTGGELAAQVVIDATVRLMPNVLGNSQSAIEESFSNGLLEHPQYTRPSEWNGFKIPEVLLSGNHGKIAKWRSDQSQEITKERRPDLWAAYQAKTLKQNTEKE